MASIGGTGVVTRGGSIVTLTAAGTTRNTLDDGAGNEIIASNLTVQGTMAINVAGVALTISNGRINTSTGTGPQIMRALRWTDVQAPSTNYNVLSTDSVILATGGAGGINVNLPAPAGVGAGTMYGVKKVDAGAGAVTIVPGAGTIDGGASVALATQNQGAICINDGTNWFVLVNSGGIL